MNKNRIASLVLLLLAAGCTTTQPLAPVIDRTVPPVPEKRPQAERPKADAPGFYTVKRGDTLLRIALDHGLNYRDIVAWNNLADPNDIKAEQVLRLTAPEGGAVTSQVADRAAEVRKPPATPPAAIANAKSGPRADKKPYSEAALADAQKAEQVPVPAPVPAPPVAAAKPPVPAPRAANDDDDGKGMNWIWPAEGKIIATFDEGRNKGIDIAGRPGQPVLAAGPGKIMYAGSGIRGYGNLVIVRHSATVLSAYAHNKTILVKEDQVVQKGQPIAEMGNSDADTVKLHFEIRQQGKPVDPAKFLPTR